MLTHLLLCALLLAPQPPLLFHATFDGTITAEANGDGEPAKVDGPIAYRPGRLGQALLCGEGGAALEYQTQGNLRPEAGTVSMWVCPVDWTGDEDEFHVFLEAKNPGWLVFYRYYQGGILTLTGTDGKNYRSAASKKIQWRQGEWHHLAGTWRARRLEVYIDGERQGQYPAPLLPEELPATFTLGDLPWHVARQRQTLVDEVKLYAAPLSPESIAHEAKGEPLDYQPEVLIDLQPSAATGKLTVNCDAAGLVGELGTGRTAKVQLTSAGALRPAATDTVTSFPRDLGQTTFDVSRLPEGDYEVTVELLDANGKPVATGAAPFHKPGPPDWRGNQLGLGTDVPPPWTPLTGNGTTLGCWNRQYTFGTLLDQVTSDGTKLLASPVTLEAVVAGRTVPLAGTAKLEGTTGAKATLSSTASAAGLKLQATQELEFDGYTWTDLTVQADQPVTVDELRLTWTMPQSEATLLHADRQKWLGNPAGTLPAEGYTSAYTHFFWLGNEQHGLSWYAESTEGWTTSDDRPTIELKPEGDRVRATIRFLASPTELAAPLHLSYGLMATPCRPRPAGASAWRMDPAHRSTISCIWPNGNFKWYGYTEPLDPDKMKAKVTSIHDRDALAIPYINLNYLSAGAPEWQYYGEDWSIKPTRGVLPSDVAAMGHASMGVCPASRDWQDLILYRINQAITDYDFDGIYIDCWSPYPCTGDPCGWTDAAGKRQPTRPIRAYRQILERVYRLCRERQPNAKLMVHMSSQVDIPMLSFTDTILDGEQFRSSPLKADYLEVLPPDMFRAEFLGRNYGPVEFFLPEIPKEHQAEASPNLAAYLLLHDVAAWPIWCDASAFNRVYDALDTIGAADVKFGPYWQQSGATAAEGVLVSSLVGPSGTMLAVMNTGEATTAKVTLDLERLALKSLSKATDVLRDEAMGVAGTTLTVKLERHQGRVIRLE